MVNFDFLSWDLAREAKMSVNSDTHLTSRQGVGEELEPLQKRITELESLVEVLQKRVAALGVGVEDSARRYVARCPECATDFDMLAHHYSIGLFDNLVYVKCPKCQKTLPLRGGPGGKIQTVED